MKPLGDTRRTLDWGELPAPARELNAAGPRLDAVLMPHQIEWLKIKAQIKVASKGRRTGITYAEAQDKTLRAAARRAAGGDNVFYIGDTKDKGLEFIGYCAHFARVIAEAQGEGISGIEEFLFADQDEKGQSKNITAWRIRFASGHQIMALASRPANIRGLQGIVIIDEAAFHTDVEGVLKAATALLIWGGEIVVISTHNGKGSPFNLLIKDIEKGLYGANAVVYRVTFDDAVANGLYERVCLIKGWEATGPGKKAWYNNIRNAYGPRQAAMREELDAIPRDGAGKSIPGVWIDQAMPEVRPVLRLRLGDDFAHRSEARRLAFARDWLARELRPLLQQLHPDRAHVFGMDYARHRHFSVIMPAEITPLLHRFVPFIIELQNVPTRQQEHILWALIKGLPRFAAGSIDATGPGSILAEYTADKFGRHRIHEVTLTRKWYGEFMPKFVGAFEDGTINLPRDAVTEADLRAIEEIDGIPMIMKPDQRDLKEPELYRHGDSASAGALMWHASLHRAGPIEYTPAPPKAARWEPPRAFGAPLGLRSRRGSTTRIHAGVHGRGMGTPRARGIW